MSLKFIITLMKDYQTIDELKSIMKISEDNEVNDNPDPKINSFKKVMSLSYDLPSKINYLLTVYTVKTLICLAKYTSFFSAKWEDMQYDDFLKNEDFIFIASLLLRLVKISALNSHSISNVTAVSNLQLHYHLAGKSTRTRGFCMGLISSMINNSCAPNIKRCFSDDLKYVFYALEPITSGTQLLDSYNNCFYESPLRRRKSLHTNFLCKCIACEEDWPPLIIEGVDQDFMEQKMRLEIRTFRTEMKFIERINPLIERILRAKRHEKKHAINKNLIRTMADMMNKLADALPQPSLARCMLLNVFDEIFEKYYGLTVPFDNICSK
ncbi:uncharacterized protein LOC106659731 [Trichogramma pretiosum]|uniref:uncharacterized protein LOC106659731 n=1 Tax=Trichogramma pretiosum TaxID=7493 RepID=UPI000C71945E|nr:uncharacterized protein LOC106659731 [Trichogramma pretiosum]